MSNLFEEMMDEISEKNIKIADLEAKLAEEKNTSAELVSLIDTMRDEDPKIKELETQLAEKEEQIKTRVAEYEKQFIEQTDEIYKLKLELAQIYSHLGVEAFGEDIHEQALREISAKDEQINNLINVVGHSYREQIVKLEQQLAEKEKEIKN